MEIEGKTFQIRSLTAGEYLKVIRTKAKNGDDTGLLLALSLVDDDGNRLFTDNQASDLSEIDALFSLPLYHHIMEFSGLNRTIREAEKNSEPTPTSDST